MLGRVILERADRGLSETLAIVLGRLPHIFTKLDLLQSTIPSR